MSLLVHGLCERQLRDINPEDVLNGGLYRKCNIYKGGGGYDKFSDIYKRRKNITDKDFNNQFVVQLYGCPLNCPYCYVTKEGTHDEKMCVVKEPEELIEAFKESGCNVFHLMGGAPDMYVNEWESIIKLLPEGTVFHSDFLCQGRYYLNHTLKRLGELSENCLYAVSVKGATAEEFKKNTNTNFREDQFWVNLANLHLYKVPFYLTFTGMSEESINLFKQQVKHFFSESYKEVLQDSFYIDLVKYEALNP